VTLPIFGLASGAKGKAMKMHRSVRWLVFAVMMVSLSAASFGQIVVGVSVRVAPPALPVYTQPICPGPGYMWTPGYWSWNDDAGYYWVPGTWVIGPVGLLWTPGYWGWSGGVYGWRAGYWGPHIGFYGGVNYGYGYGGVGFAGGEWRGRSFYYNRSVTNVTNVTTVYNRTVIVNENHVAFNGGQGGVAARPNHAEEIAEHEHHREPLAAQTHHEHMASQNKQNFATENHGRPAIAATAKPGEFKGHGVVGAKAAGAAYHPPAMSPKEARGPYRPAASHGSTPTSANNKSMPANHSFTPPNKNNTASNNTNGNHPNNMSNNKAENSMHTNVSHPAKGFNPPSNSSHPSNQTHAQNAPHPQSEAHAQNHPAPQPHQDAPKSAPQHQSAPNPATHHGKGR
jgi:WXXGXW repeat (2 copies)